MLHKNLLDSLKNNKEGFSARKLTAFVFVIMCCYIHIRYVNSDNCIEALMIDGGIILISLGIVTAQNLIALKNGNKEEPKEENENAE